MRIYIYTYKYIYIRVYIICILFIYIYIFIHIYIYIYDGPHAWVCVVDSFVSIELFDLWVYHSLPLYIYIYTFIMYRHMQKVCICVHQEVVEHPCVFLSWRPRPSTLALLGAVVKSWSFELDDGEIWNKCINENWIIMVFCRCFSKPIHFHECCLIELARFCPSFKENERTCKIWTVVATCFSCVCVLHLHYGTSYGSAGYIAGWAGAVSRLPRKISI